MNILLTVNSSFSWLHNPPSQIPCNFYWQEKNIKGLHNFEEISALAFPGNETKFLFNHSIYHLLLSQMQMKTDKQLHQKQMQKKWIVTMKDRGNNDWNVGIWSGQRHSYCIRRANLKLNSHVFQHVYIQMLRLF